MAERCEEEVVGSKKRKVEGASENLNGKAGRVDFLSALAVLKSQGSSSADVAGGDATPLQGINIAFHLSILLCMKLLIFL